MKMTKKAKQLYKTAYYHYLLFENVWGGLSTAYFNQYGANIPAEEQQRTADYWNESTRAFGNMNLIREIFGDACDFLADEQKREIYQDANNEAARIIAEYVDEVPEAYRAR